MILWELIGLNIIFDAHLRMLAKHLLFGIWEFFSYVGRGVGSGDSVFTCWVQCSEGPPWC